MVLSGLSWSDLIIALAEDAPGPPGLLPSLCVLGALPSPLDSVIAGIEAVEAVAAVLAVNAVQAAGPVQPGCDVSEL